MDGEGTRNGQAWRRRPVLGNLVRTLIVLGPLAFSVAVGLGNGRGNGQGQGNGHS